MNRREFIGFAACTLGAAVVAPKLLLPENPPGPVTQTYEFTPMRPYQPGDTITVTGFGHPAYNGTFVMNADHVFERIK
jgi:hypothetical protein